MYGLKKLLTEEEKRLSQLKNNIAISLKSAPEGNLRVSSSGKQVQFLHCVGEDRKEKMQGKYIRKDNYDLARSLAQKGYDLKMQKLIDRRLNQLSKLNAEYRDSELADLYTDLSPIRKNLVSPYVLPWEQMVSAWKATPYVGKSFDEGVPEIYTKKGERVRSKTEKILADMFNDMGIEYKYECPLYVKGYGIIYPDFTFLSRKTCQPIYWEHYGKMDDPKYAEKAVRKIDTYIKNGIIPGVNLIITYETSRIVPSSPVLQRMIESFLL
jgi:hypothetical protein